MNIYQSNILDKYENPQHSGKPNIYTHMHLMQNTTCGDEVTVFLTVNDNKITHANHVAEGCVISLASAEIMCEKVLGMNIDEVLTWTWEDAVKILNIELSATRIKCAHLPLEAIQRAIKASEE